MLFHQYRGHWYVAEDAADEPERLYERPSAYLKHQVHHRRAFPREYNTIQSQPDEQL